MAVDFHHVEPGKVFEDFFLVHAINEKEFAHKDGKYLIVDLYNEYGHVPMNVWEHTEKFKDSYVPGHIIKVRGQVELYKERRQLKFERVWHVSDSDQISKEDLLPQWDIDRDALWKQVDEKIESVKNPFLKQLLTQVFQDGEFREQYGRASAGKMWHHCYVGGLLHHSVSLVAICEGAVEAHPTANRDLLIAGCLLHDIGKIDEIAQDVGFDYTNEGRLIGHVVLGAMRVENAIRAVPDFPDSLRNQMVHLVLSHQGKLEQAAPVVPMTLEAFILHFADELDSKANAFERIAKMEKEPGKEWSKWVKLLDRYFYFPDSEGGKV